MNRRIKLCVAVCALGFVALVSSLNLSARGGSKIVKGCFGSDKSVCFTEGQREYYGQWREIRINIDK